MRLERLIAALQELLDREGDLYVYVDGSPLKIAARPRLGKQLHEGKVVVIPVHGQTSRNLFS